MTIEGGFIILQDDRVKFILSRMQKHCQRTAEHSLRVGYYAQLLGEDTTQKKLLYICGLLHDVGKLFVPSELLNKKGVFTAEESHKVKKHPQWGKKILETNLYPLEIVSAAFYHHERLTGNGYPHRLTEIPYEARVIAVADVWDALIEDRPYRRAYPIEQAKKIIQREAKQLTLDPVLVRNLLHLVDNKKINNCRAVEFSVL